MVQRRMFSKQITDMDTFLDMPATARSEERRVGKECAA